MLIFGLKSDSMFMYRWNKKDLAVYKWGAKSLIFVDMPSNSTSMVRLNFNQNLGEQEYWVKTGNIKSKQIINI